MSNSSSFHNTHLSPFTFTRTVCVSSCVALAGYTGRGDAAPPHYPSDRTRHRDNVGGTENGGVKSGAESASRESTRGRRRRPRFSCCAAVQRASDDILILPSFLPPKPRQPQKGKGEGRGSACPSSPSAVVSRSVGLHDGRTGGTGGTGQTEGTPDDKRPKENDDGDGPYRRLGRTHCERGDTDI